MKEPKAETIKLHENTLSGRPVPEGYLRYDFKMDFHGITLYATAMSQQDYAQWRRETRAIMRDGREMVKSQTRLRNEAVALQREFDLEKTGASRREVIQSRLDAIDAEFEAVEEAQEAVLDRQLALMDGLCATHLVAASWKEDGRDVFTRDCALTTAEAKNEVGQVLIARSRMGVGDTNALNGR